MQFVGLCYNLSLQEPKLSQWIVTLALFKLFPPTAYASMIGKVMPRVFPASLAIPAFRQWLPGEAPEHVRT